MKDIWFYNNTYLYFRPIGLPVLRKVKVFNLNGQSSIQMLSISGNTIHFHCSFFKDKVIPPSGNTSFDVVFLGREEGIVENTLYIHTSAGSFRFQVKKIKSQDFCIYVMYIFRPESHLTIFFGVIGTR